MNEEDSWEMNIGEMNIEKKKNAKWGGGMILILSHIHVNLGGKSLTGEYESGVNVFENRGTTSGAYSHRFYQMDYAWLGRSETIYFCPFIKYRKEGNASSPKISNINKPVTFC